MSTPKKTLKQGHHHNLRSRSSNKSPTKTLNVKKQNVTITNKGKSKREDSKSESSPEIKCHFATEKINLPRGKVIRTSRSSSANGSLRNSNSPVKLPRFLQEPTY